MECFIKAVYDHYELLPGEDNDFILADDTIIYLEEDAEKITLLCPCFPLPHEYHALLALLAYNCRGDTLFGVEEDIVVARRTIYADTVPADMAKQFGVFIADILSVKKDLGLGQPDF
ncbi:hypothetical protein ABK905_20940 [Acerihabitans sp. KWT182]|uniref:Uncharacterized protein n=1 Tax=Acerihabitans sp. KWT182 TaxID=3157919 RepID=A0AAU7Q9U0_9GAMM